MMNEKEMVSVTRVVNGKIQILNPPGLTHDCPECGHACDCGYPSECIHHLSFDCDHDGDKEEERMTKKDICPTCGRTKEERVYIGIDYVRTDDGDMKIEEKLECLDLFHSGDKPCANPSSSTSAAPA
jgi:hypothetical protein